MRTTPQNAVNQCKALVRQHLLSLAQQSAILLSAYIIHGLHGSITGINPSSEWYNIFDVSEFWRGSAAFIVANLLFYMWKILKNLRLLKKHMEAIKLPTLRRELKTLITTPQIFQGNDVREGTMVQFNILTAEVHSPDGTRTIGTLETWTVIEH